MSSCCPAGDSAIADGQQADIHEVVEEGSYGRRDRNPWPGGLTRRQDLFFSQPGGGQLPQSGTDAVGRMVATRRDVENDEFTIDNFRYDVR